MSDFWTRRLGTPAPAPRTEPVGTTQPWWQIITYPDLQRPEPAHPAPDSGTQQWLDEKSRVSVSALKAPSSQQTARCPACGSGNYFVPLGHANAAARCFECNYPRLQQLSGAGFQGNDENAQPARQVVKGGFFPQMIIGRLS